jgi:hypothetical protein
MATELPRALLAVKYEEAAQAYLRSLPLEHFMEATAQATQRKITLESLDLLHARRPEVQVFNELLVQYPRPRQRRLGQVVPDNMVVLCEQPIRAETSYNLPLEPARPFWMFEYVSKSNRRKDYRQYNLVHFRKNLARFTKAAIVRQVGWRAEYAKPPAQKAWQTGKLSFFRDASPYIRR